MAGSPPGSALCSSNLQAHLALWPSRTCALQDGREPCGYTCDSKHCYCWVTFTLEELRGLLKATLSFFFCRKNFPEGITPSGVRVATFPELAGNLVRLDHGVLRRFLFRQLLRYRDSGPTPECPTIGPQCVRCDMPSACSGFVRPNPRADQPN